MHIKPNTTTKKKLKNKKNIAIFTGHVLKLLTKDFSSFDEKKGMNNALSKKKKS